MFEAPETREGLSDMFRELASRVIADEVEKLALIHSPVFMRTLMDVLIDIEDVRCVETVNYALIVLNSLLYVIEEAVPVMFTVNATTYLMENAVKLFKLLDNDGDDVKVLKALTWNFKAFTKIIYYDGKCIYTLNKDFFQMMVHLMEYVPQDQDEQMKMLELQEGYDRCILQLYNMIPNLTIMSKEQKNIMFPCILDKVKKETNSILCSLYGFKDDINSSKKEDINEKIIKYMDENSKDFQNCYESTTLPIGSPIQVIPIYLPSLLYSLSFVMVSNENLIPKNVYYVLCGFLNSENLHLRLSTINVLQNFVLQASKKATILKYLPYLMYFFHNNSLFSNDIPIIKPHKPFHLLLQLCKFNDPLILEKLVNYNILTLIVNKILSFLLEQQKKSNSFKYVLLEDLESLLYCFDILNCFLGLPNYKQMVINQFLSPNDINSIISNILTLNLKFSSKLENIILKRLKKLAKLFNFLNKNFFKVLVINKLTQSLVFFLKALSMDVLLLRSFFIINFNKEVIIKLLFNILKFPTCHIEKTVQMLGVSDHERHSIVLSNDFGKQNLLNGLVNQITNFENFRELLNSIVETKSLICLFLANLSLEFSPLQGFLLENGLVDVIKRGLFESDESSDESSDDKSNKLSTDITHNLNNVLSDKLPVSAANTPHNKLIDTSFNTDNLLTFINYINESNLQPYNKMEYITKLVSAANQDFFQITDIDTNENFMHTNNLNYSELNSHVCTLYNQLQDVSDDTMPNIVLKINYCTLASFSSIYSYKLSNLIMLKNLLYESNSTLKDEVLEKIGFRHLLSPLLINPYNGFNDDNLIKLRSMILDYQTQLYNIVRNLVSSCPETIAKLEQNIKETNDITTQPISRAHYVKKMEEDYCLSLLTKQLTVINIIEKPKLVSNILFIIVNVLTLKEYYRNIIILNDTLLTKVKYILDLKLPNIHSDISETNHENVLYNFISLDLQQAHPTQQDSNESKLINSPSSSALSLHVKKDKPKPFTALLEKFKEFCSSSEIKKDSNIMLTNNKKFDTEYLNIKLACIWIVINLIWDQDDPEPLNEKEYDADGDLNVIDEKSDIINDSPRATLTIIDRWKKLMELGFYDSLLNYKNYSVLDIKQRAVAALNNFDVIKQELEDMP